MKLSIIIINYNTPEITLNCIKSIYTSTKQSLFEIICVDNNSSDNSVSVLKKFADSKSNFVLVKSRENNGFGDGNNKGLKKAKGEYILFLNSDTIVSEGSLEYAVNQIERTPNIGVLSLALKNNDGTLQGTGGYFPNLVRVFSWMTIQDIPLVDTIILPFHPMKEKSFIKSNGFYSSKRELDWVTGAFLLTRKSILNTIGGFDTDYFMYTEEVDLCFRIKKKGYSVIYDPTYSIVHLGGVSSTKEFSVLNEFKGVKTFYSKHYPAWQMPLLRFLLKFGSLWRIPVMGILEGPSSATTYVKAFKTI